MIWGLFPGVYKNVSWESHMLGFFSGVLLAIIYRKQGPQAPVYEWLEQEEEDGESGELTDNNENTGEAKDSISRTDGFF